MDDNHLMHYFILTVGVLMFAIFLVFFRYNVTAQMIVIALGSAFYVIWGFVHHVLMGRLTKLVASEYILIGAFVFLILYLALSF